MLIQNFFKKCLIHFLVLKSFKKEIQEDLELEKKYKLAHTEEEMSKRKETQEKFKHLYKQRWRTPLNGLRKTWKWLRKNYFNTEVKDSIETYEYSKTLRRNFIKMTIDAMIKSSGYTFLLFLWMRLIKHKGKKDLRYLFLMNAILSTSVLSAKSYYMIPNTPLPLTKRDLDNRKDLLEEFVYGANHSVVLTEEIKKISRHYIPGKIEHSFVTNLGQPVTLLILQGRLYLSCDNYAEVFGYAGKNKLAKMENLDVMNPRNREIIYGLFQFYDKLIDEYIKKYKINTNVSNYETKMLQEIAGEKNLNQEKINVLKNSNLFKNIEFDKLNANNQTKLENKNANEPEKKQKPKFFI